LAEADRKSQTPSQTSSFLRKRALTVKSSKHSRLTAYSRREPTIVADEPVVEPVAEDSELDQDQQQDDAAVECNEDQIPAQEEMTIDAQRPDAVSVGTIRSTKSYVSKLEKQLQDEIEKRSKLENEIYEMKKIN